MRSTNLKSQTSNLVAIFEKFGDIGQYAIPIVITVYTFSCGKKVESIAMGIFGFIQYLEVSALKKYFSRHRPKPYIIGKVSRQDNESFPSSHTGGAFLGVGLVLGLYGKKSPFTITALALSTLVGVSRYLSEKHWPTDILAGALIGTIHGFAASQIRYLIKA